MMEQVEISNAAKEVLCLCEYFDPEINMKIPENFLLKLKELASASNIIVSIDYKKKLTEQNISETAKKNIRCLDNAIKYLHKDTDLYLNLSQSAKKKRVYDRSNPAYKWVALAITLMGLGAFGYGIYSLATHAGFGIYFLLFGLAAIFLFSGASVLPTSHNNRSYIEKQLLNAVDEMEQYIKTYPDFPVPACYAHPVVLKRMQDILKEGRAETIPAALRVLKEDLKALNSSVVVEQEEYDEIVAIKPMFLVMDYR